MRAELLLVEIPTDITKMKAEDWERDIIELEFLLNEDRTISVPRGPGIGVEVQEDRLEEVMIQATGH